MFKKTMITMTVIIGISSVAIAGDIAALFVDPDFKYAVLEDMSLQLEYQARIGDIVSGWKVEGITKNFVTISKVYKGRIFVTQLPLNNNNIISRSYNIQSPRGIQR